MSEINNTESSTTKKVSNKSTTLRRSRRVTHKASPESDLKTRIVQDSINPELEGKSSKKCELILLYIRYLESIDEIKNNIRNIHYGGTNSSVNNNSAQGFDCLKELSEEMYKKHSDTINKQKRKTILVLKNEIADLFILRNKFLEILTEKEQNHEQIEKKGGENMNKYKKYSKTRKIRFSIQHKKSK